MVYSQGDTADVTTDLEKERSSWTIWGRPKGHHKRPDQREAEAVRQGKKRGRRRDTESRDCRATRGRRRPAPKRGTQVPVRSLLTASRGQQPSWHPDFSHAGPTVVFHRPELAESKGKRRRTGGLQGEKTVGQEQEAAGSHQLEVPCLRRVI